MEPDETTRLNNELINSAKPDQKESEVKKPKRNSKEELLTKILKVVEKYELDFDYSDTRLKRMNKQELTKVLAEVMEKRQNQCSRYPMETMETMELGSMVFCGKN